MTTIAWNTGAFYTEHGQRIVAMEDPDGGAWFYDLDRGVDGYLPPAFFPHANLRHRVEQGYMQSGWEYWSYTGLDYTQTQVGRNLAREAALTAPSLKPV